MLTSWVPILYVALVFTELRFRLIKPCDIGHSYAAGGRCGCGKAKHTMEKPAGAEKWSLKDSQAGPQPNASQFHDEFIANYRP